MIVHCDGGCRGNGTDHAETYGSFKIDFEARPHRLFLNVSTNNEAEYQTLIEALEYLAESGFSQPTILMDSALVVNQVNGLWKCREPRLSSFVDKAKKLLKRVNGRLSWVPREQMVSILGH